MSLYVENNVLTGYIDYVNDNCSGELKGKILSNTKLELSEKITKGADLCDNGKHLLELKHNIISEAIYYDLSNDRHKVSINKYQFIANSDTWNNVLLKKKIIEQKIEISKIQIKINTIKSLIAKAKKNKQEAENYLDYNLSNYVDNTCITPALKKKPILFFDTEEKAQKHALAYCSVSFGCRVGIELARDKLNTTSKRFLASQGCSLLLKDYIGNNTLSEETMFNLLDAVSYEGCGSEAEGILSALFKGGSCVMSTATRLARVGQYINCIDYKTEKFHNTYLDWKNEPQKKKMDCDTNVKLINNTPKIVLKLNEEISKLTNKQSKYKKQLEVQNNRLETIKLLRKKQSALLDGLTQNNLDSQK